MAATNDDIEIMLDLETFGTSSDAVVTEIGALAWKSSERRFIGKFNFHVNAEEQIKVGRTMTPGTTMFWMEQDLAARTQVIEGQAKASQTKVADTLRALQNWSNRVSTRDLKWWARGTHFDMTILGSLFDDYEMASPWKFWQVRDVRTAIEVQPHTFKLDKVGTAHAAADDCASQVIDLEYSRLTTKATADFRALSDAYRKSYGAL
jgi:hypothetical protein